MIERPIPIDMAALRTLRRSPLALDLYVWLTHRYSYLKAPVVIPWESLHLQFGADYGRIRDFRAKVIRSLQAVVAVYPEARLSSTPAGLELRPSPTHVKRVLTRGD